MKFVCDAMLGKLAKYIRILGLDAEYMKNLEELKHYYGRTDAPYFLTRKTRKMTYERTIFIRSDKVREQLHEIKEIIRPFIDPGKIMNRCIECNVELINVQKKHIEQKVPEFVFHQYGRFRECPECGKVYWEGSHTTGMADLVQEIMEVEEREAGKTGQARKK